MTARSVEKPAAVGIRTKRSEIRKKGEGLRRDFAESEELFP